MIAKSAPCFRYNGNCKIAILPFCFRYNGNWVFSISTSCFLCNRKIFCNFTPLFPVQWEILQKCQFSSFSHSNGNKTHFLKKSQFHFKKKQAFSGFLAFPIRKETSGCLKTLFPFFVPAATQYIFLRKREKPQPVRVFQLSVVFSGLL